MRSVFSKITFYQGPDSCADQSAEWRTFTKTLTVPSAGVKFDGFWEKVTFSAFCTVKEDLRPSTAVDGLLVTKCGGVGRRVRRFVKYSSVPILHAEMFPAVTNSATSFFHRVLVCKVKHGLHAISAKLDVGKAVLSQTN